MDWEPFWNALLESGIDRLLFGEGRQYAVRLVRRYWSKAWRHRLRTITAFKKTTPLQKQIIGAWVLGIVPMMIGGVMGDATPLWTILWLTGVLLALAVGIGYAYLRATLRPNRSLP